MTFRKNVLIAALLLTLVWLLTPGRTDSTPDAIEIAAEVWRGPAMDTAIRLFEEESRRAHERDPEQPIYRIITGQTAARDVSEDPTRFLLGVAGGSPPDVIDFDRYAVAQWAWKGAFRPLDDFLARDRDTHAPERILPKDFYPATWEEVTIRTRNDEDPHVYAIPNSVDNRGLYYNKDILARAGFVDAQGEARPPETLEELGAMGVALTTRDSKGHLTRVGFAPHLGHTHLYLFGWMYGGRFMSDDGRRCTLDDPGVVQGLRWLTGFYDRIGGARDVFAFQSGLQGGGQDPFLQGKVAMLIDGFWRLDRLSDFGQFMNYAVAPPPVSQALREHGETAVSWLGGWAYAIPSTAKHPQAAWEFIRFLSSWRVRHLMAEADRLERASRGRTFVPLQTANRKFNERLYREFIYENPRVDPKLREAVKVMNDLLPHSRSRPVTPAGQRLWNEAVAATEKAVFHQASPLEALEEADAAVQRDLDERLAPPKGAHLSWRWFLWIYVGLLVVSAILICRLDRPEPHPWRGGGWVGVLPWLIGFAVFTGGPILFSILISFSYYDVLNPARFAGSENYQRLLTADPLFWKSLGNTLYMLLGVPVGMALSLGMALLLNARVRGVALWRSCFYLPSIVPAVAASLLWIWIFNPNNGLLNMALASIGIEGPRWLVDERTSKLSLILMGLWSAGGGMIIWLAGLRGINPAYYEAARIDGAGAWQRFRRITLPLLGPCILFNLVVGVIATSQIFTQAFIMTEGGPVHSTLFYVYYLFNNAFRYLQFGYAAAMAWVLFLLVFALTAIQLNLSRRWVHYEGD